MSKYLNRKTEADDIKRMREAIQRTKSKNLKEQYAKAIKIKIFELKHYCKYKGIDYYELGITNRQAS